MNVSFVIPTIGRDSLDAAIESCRQSGIESEVIVVGVSSEDADKSITPETQVTPPIARNLGFSHAEHDWVVGLDDDDRFISGAVKVLLDAAEPGDVAVTGWVESQQDGVRVGYNKRGTDWPELLARNVVGTNSGVMVRREVWETVQYDPEQSYADDHDFWIRLREHGNIRVINEPVVVYDETSDNKKTDDLSQTVTRRRIIEKHRHRIRLLSKREQLRVLSLFWHEQYRQEAIKMLDQNRVSGLMSAAKSVLYDPRCLSRWSWWRSIGRSIL